MRVGGFGALGFKRRVGIICWTILGWGMLLQTFFARCRAVAGGVAGFVREWVAGAMRWVRGHWFGIGVVYLGHGAPYWWIMENLQVIHSRPVAVWANVVLNALLAPTLLLLAIHGIRRRLALLYIAGHHLLILCAYWLFLLHYSYFERLPDFFLLQQAGHAHYLVKQVVFQVMGADGWITLALISASFIAAALWHRRIARPVPLAAGALAALLVASFAVKDAVVHRTMAQVQGNLQAKSFKLRGFTGYAAEQFDVYLSHRRVARIPWPGKISAVAHSGTAAQSGAAAAAVPGPRELKNILIVQVESLDKWVIDHRIDGREVMPRLRAIKNQSRYFENFFAMHSGGYSSDAELSALTGLLPQQYLGLNAKNLPLVRSLTKFLAGYGYSSAGMHANWPTYFNRANAYPQLGFDQVFHQLHYTGDAAGWKSKDIAFFEQSWPRIEALPRPFFAYLVTIQSHGHFENHSADTLSSLELPAGIMGDYLRAVHEVDQAIGFLWEKLRGSGLLEETIVLLYGDHPSYVKARDCIHGECVPFMIHAPGVAAGVDSALGSHIDVAPTIVGLLGIPEPPGAWLGASLLHPNATAGNAGGGRKVLFRNGTSIVRDPAGGWRGRGLMLRNDEADRKYIQYSDAVFGGLAE